MSQNRWTEAAEVVNRFLRIAPESGDAHILNAWLQAFLADAEGALAAARRAIELQPSAERHRKLLLYLHYCDSVDPRMVRAEHEAWDARWGRACEPVAANVNVRRQAGRPPRVGLVSADFKSHPTAYLALRGLEAVDRNELELVYYSDVAKADVFTERFQKTATLWRNTFGMTDEELAAQIRRDEVDILLDLMGHVGKRLLVFARRPAPLQGSWLGYVGTTGLRAMDFLLADRFHVRAGEETFYTERVVRLPNDYICFSPPDYCPEVGPSPALANGFVTFGCFNSPVKYSARILEAWATVLRRVSSARLLLKYAGLDDRLVQKKIVARLIENGVEAERILFEGKSQHAAHLAAYHRVDVALDTQPYSGGLTTCDALWMGVPVMTCPGNRFEGRHSTSHLMNSGNEPFIGENLEQYVELAVTWASRIEELAIIRAGLREQVAKSPLCDAKQFAVDFVRTLGEEAARIPRIHG
jgi:predicted O-linked N-acetylglucosamine transferase (SPINDLY family)